jgi:hypothetical protein
MSRVYRTCFSDYKEWLHQKIWLTGNEQGFRKEYIPAFWKSLTQFMKKKGYVMDERWNKGPTVVARWLYAIHVHEIARHDTNKPLGYPTILHRDWPEDYDVFDFHIDIQAIEEFIDNWRNVEDMDVETSHGFRTQVELQKLLYTYVDIGNSVQGRRLSAKLIQDESENSEGGQDEYVDLMSGAFGTTKKILGYNTM